MQINRDNTLEHFGKSHVQYNSNRIHQVLGNLVRICNISNQTYVDEDELWMGILDVSVFAICSTTNSLKGYSPGQLIFVHDMILPIKHRTDW